MKRVLTAAILIPLVILALFKAPLWLFSLLVLGVALLAAREYLDIAQANGLNQWFWGADIIALIIAGILSDRLRVRKPFMLFGALASMVMRSAYPSFVGSSF